MKAIVEIISRFEQVIKFGFVGITNTVISYVVYVILVFFGCHYIVANVLAYFAGVINSFVWNSRYVFKIDEDETRNPWKAFIKTAMISAFTGLVLSNALLLLWVEVLHLSEYIGPVLNLVITFPINYLLNKYWAYAKD